jgi:arylsulfatase A-like enzyme
LRELAKGAVVFRNAISQDTQTTPSHASMFTGLYPHVHGSEINGHHLDAEWRALAQILRDAGFETGGFVSSITMDGKVTGLDRGFDEYRDENRNGEETATKALEWWRRSTGERRRFLFVHFYDAHGPYLPKGEYARLFHSDEPGPLLRHVQPGHVVSDSRGRELRNLNGYVDRYDSMIRYVDDRVGRILRHVDLNRTVVVVIADHGETLGERYHMLDHGGQVFDEQIRIPLIIRAKGVEPRHVDEPVETVDLLPTLVELLGVAMPDDVPKQGHSLTPLMHGKEIPWRSVTFSTSRCDPTRLEDRGYHLDKHGKIQTIRSRDWKLVTYPGLENDYLELYDLGNDPGESRNVAEEKPLLVRSFARRLREWGGEQRLIATPAVSDEVRERLRQLGYLE